MVPVLGVAVRHSGGKRRGFQGGGNNLAFQPILIIEGERDDQTYSEGCGFGLDCQEGRRRCRAPRKPQREPRAGAEASHQQGVNLGKA
jgi:hypothetical protein